MKVIDLEGVVGRRQKEKANGFIYVQSARTNVELFQLSMINRASMAHVGYIGVIYATYRMPLSVVGAA